MKTCQFNLEWVIGFRIINEGNQIEYFLFIISSILN